MEIRFGAPSKRSRSRLLSDAFSGAIDLQWAVSVLKRRVVRCPRTVRLPASAQFRTGPSRGESSLRGTCRVAMDAGLCHAIDYDELRTYPER